MSHVTSLIDGRLGGRGKGSTEDEGKSATLLALVLWSKIMPSGSVDERTIPTDILREGSNKGGRSGRACLIGWGMVGTAVKLCNINGSSVFQGKL